MNDQFLKTLTRCLAIGPVEAMTQDEIAKGYTPIKVGEKPWFSKRHWNDGVLSKNGKEVRIIAIIAKQQGRGSFRKMVDGIRRDGLTPVVICPFSQMEAILKKWGWEKTVVGGSFLEREEQWRAPADKKGFPA